VAEKEGIAEDTGAEGRGKGRGAEEPEPVAAFRPWADFLSRARIPDWSADSHEGGAVGKATYGKCEAILMS